MKKEILTTEQIKQELKSKTKHNLYQAVPLLVVPLLPIFLLLYLCSYYQIWSFITVILIIFPIVYLAIPSIAGFTMLLKSLKILYFIKNDKIYITQGKLISSSEDTKGHPHSLFPTKEYILNFNICEQYIIPNDKYYQWSKDYAMNSKGVFDTAVNGDEFYLVVICSKEILLVYNSKFFQLNNN